MKFHHSASLKENKSFSKVHNNVYLLTIYGLKEIWKTAFQDICEFEQFIVTSSSTSLTMRFQHSG